MNTDKIKINNVLNCIIDVQFDKDKSFEIIKSQDLDTTYTEELIEMARTKYFKQLEREQYIFSLS